MELTKEHYSGGKIAYDAYCKQTGGVSLVSGDKLPEFNNLKTDIQDAWAASYIAISLLEDMKFRPVLLLCKNRFETIKETNPEIHLDDDINRITECLK